MSIALRRMNLVALVLLVILGGASIAAAQGGRRPVRRYQGLQEPAVSPYLSLVPGTGLNPGLSYFNLVQPQVMQQRNAQMQGQQIRGLSAQLQQDERQGPFGALTPIRTTGGRAATFQNYSHYYPSMGAGGGGGGPARTYRVTTGGGGMGMGGMGMGGGF